LKWDMKTGAAGFTSLHPPYSYGVIARSEATKQSRGGVIGRTYGLPRLLLTRLGEWLAMT
jgi:hypothetical protein